MPNAKGQTHALSVVISFSSLKAMSPCTLPKRLTIGETA